MTLSADQLRREAREATGLENYGAGPLNEGLERLCDSLNHEAKLHQSGQTQVANRIRGHLIQRLNLEDWYLHHPEMDAEVITEPIIVFGLPRSGTTALAQFLAQDTKMRSIRRWESIALTPPPGTETEITDPRIEAAYQAAAAQRATIPDIMSMLPNTPEDPAEHGDLLNLTFRSLSLSGVYPVPSYASWAETCDMQAAYEYLTRILKLLQWRRPPKRWNLKYPMDLYFLDTVRRVFPDAALVWCHRDPALSVPSVSDLLYTIRSQVSTQVDRKAVGQSEFEQKLEGVRRGMDFLSRHGDDTVYHVHMTELGRDPVSTIAKLYEQIGRPFETEFESALRARQVDRPRGKFGVHRYEPEDYGLDTTYIRTAFSDYIERFDIET